MNAGNFFHKKKTYSDTYMVLPMNAANTNDEDVWRFLVISTEIRKKKKNQLADTIATYNAERKPGE